MAVVAGFLPLLVAAAVDDDGFPLLPTAMALLAVLMCQLSPSTPRPSSHAAVHRSSPDQLVIRKIVRT